MFLSPMLRHADRPWMLANQETGAVLAHRVQGAFDSASRRRGLLGRDGLDDEALIIAPCTAVHTCFMRFAIDVIVVDRTGRVVRCATGVKPWRVTGALRGFATIELPPGAIDRSGTRRGHHLALLAAA